MASRTKGTAMRFAYLTWDEVNRDTAQRLARKLGIKLEVVTTLENGAMARYDGLLCDLDSLRPDPRITNPNALFDCLRNGVLAVHSRNLEGWQRRLLRRRHVILARRLGTPLLKRLLAAVAGRPEEETVA
jgi:hypothetical protein